MTGGVGQFTKVDDTADASWFIRFMDVANAVPEHGSIRSSLATALGPLRGRSVLDVGCGTGDDSRELAALGADVVATDISSAMLDEARRRGGAVSFLPADVHALPFPDAPLLRCEGAHRDTQRPYGHPHDIVVTCVEATRPTVRVVCSSCPRG